MAVSGAIKRALAKTKYAHLVTGAPFDLTNREIVHKPLHENIRSVEKFFRPNSSLKWIDLENPALGMKNV